MKFTKQQRHEIYKLAYELYKKRHQSEIYVYCGMCHHLDRAIEKLHNKVFLYTALNKKLPEFKELKPAYKDIHEFWWDKDDDVSRYSAFEKIIEQTK